MAYENMVCRRKGHSTSSLFVGDYGAIGIRGFVAEKIWNSVRDHFIAPLEGGSPAMTLEREDERSGNLPCFHRLPIVEPHVVYLQSYQGARGSNHCK